MSPLILTHRACLKHDPGEWHPECPDRLRAVWTALEAEEFSLLPRDEAPRATVDQLCLIHPRGYVDQLLSVHPEPGELVSIDGDTAMSEGSAEAALRAAGAGIAAVDAVCRGEVQRVFCAVRPPGHHAEPQRPMGFCLFSNVAIAARHAQVAHGVERVAVVDFDVHHGNGTQAAFEGDPTLFYASSHQGGIFPGTGGRHETGVGNIANAPLRQGTGGEAFRAVWRDQLLPAVAAFDPGLLIISAGFDAHAADPLAQLRLHEVDFSWLTTELCLLANRHCGGRVVSMLEGGYDLDALAASVACHVRVLMEA